MSQNSMNPIDIALLGKNAVDMLFSKPKRKKRELEAGDVIYVDKTLYKHFAVYIGDNEVVHFAPDKKKKGKASIHKAPFEEFLDGKTEFTICIFPKEYGDYEMFDGYLPSSFGGAIQVPNMSSFLKHLRKFLNESDYKLYSRKQTVRRALKKANEETEYNPLFNNCEHFAIWCKTGIKESRQVQKLLDIILTVSGK